MNRYYKILDGDKSGNAGAATWSLPRGGRPGKWMPKIDGEIQCCVRGYHVVTASQLPGWLEAGRTVYEAEIRGAAHAQSDKSAHAQARLLRRVGQWTVTKRKLLDDDYDTKRDKLALRLLRSK